MAGVGLAVGSALHGGGVVTHESFRWAATTLAFCWLSGCPDPPHTEAVTTQAFKWLSGCPAPPHTGAAATLAFYWLSGCPFASL